MVEGIDDNACWPLGQQEVDCLVRLSNGVIAFIIIGWDVVWVKLLVFWSGLLDSRHCRSK